jgi:MFS family permease
MSTGKFRGWWITAAAFCTFGIAVGIPYYAMPFFYDYYEKPVSEGGFGWSRPEITLGFPLAALFTLWVGPILVHRFSPRRLILLGTALTALAFYGFGTMGGALSTYYLFWFIFVVGYIFSGPIPHQVIISQWFRRHRGKAMAVAYLGVGFFGACSAKFIARPLTEAFGFQTALQILGAIMIVAWPIAIWLMKDRPAEIGQFADGDREAHASAAIAPHSFQFLLRQRAFWLLLIGSTCSIGAIGSINQHMKLVFKDQGFTDQALLNYVFSEALFYIMVSSIAGRLVMGWMADRFTKKYVMTATYVLVGITIPLLLAVKPESVTSLALESPATLYVFAILFGFGMGADYMLIPLMAAEQFGVNSLARAMAIILPTDTIGQTWFPYGVSLLREHFGDYGVPLGAVFTVAMIGAAAIALLPGPGRKDETLHVQEPAGARVGG